MQKAETSVLSYKLVIYKKERAETVTKTIKIGTGNYINKTCTEACTGEFIASLKDPEENSEPYTGKEGSYN